MFLILKKLSRFVLIVLLVTACQNQNPKTMQTTTTFSWSCSVTSIKDYPIQVHKGYLASQKEFITAFRNNGIEDDGWDVDGQEGGSGGSIVPTLLSLTWFSHAEKKFWILDEVALPNDKILALFKEDFYNTDRITNEPVHETYQHIVVGVAPGGVAVVFLTGNYHRIEIARYQAVETIVSPDEFYDNPDRDNQQQFFDWWFEHSVPQETLSKIKKDGIPFGLWDIYRKRYNWRFDVQFYKEGDKIEKPLSIRYLNGEENKIKLGDENKIESHALPKSATFCYKEHWNIATFDESEIVEAFKKATQDNPKAEVVIIAKVQFMYKSVKFVVKCGDKEIPLEKVVVENGGHN